LNAERIQEIFEPFGRVETKRMFGAIGIYREGLCFAMAESGEIYLKTDDETRETFRAAGSRPFVYVMRGKPQEMNYWRLDDAALDDGAQLRRWAELGFAAATRAAAKKPVKKVVTKTKARKG
jgi:DNA transformation protein and related proteins